MKINRPIRILSLISAAALFCGSQAFATNGMIPHGIGAKNKAMAGAGVAIVQDAISVATNPASGTWVDNRLEAGFAIFSPFREATDHNPTTGALGGFVAPGTYESDSNAFPVPYLARNWKLNNKSAFTLAVYAAGGMNTDYPNAPWNGTGGAFPSGIDLKQLIIAPTYSWKVNQKTSFGVAALVGMQWFEARGLNTFAGVTTTGNAGNLYGNGHDFAYGLGIQLGVQHKVSSTLSFGASFKSEVNMTEFDKYAGLFAEAGDLDMPASITIGMAWKPSPKSVLAIDVQHIFYSKVPSIANSITNFTQCDAPPAAGGFGGPDNNSCFGGGNGPGFAWDDMTILKIGYQWETSPTMTWRVGVSHGSNPVKETTLSTLAPGVVETHLTFGFTKKTDKTSELTLAVMYAPETSVRKTSALSGFGINDEVELSMHQFEIELAWSKRF